MLICCCESRGPSHSQDSAQPRGAPASGPIRCPLRPLDRRVCLMVISQGLPGSHRHCPTARHWLWESFMVRTWILQLPLLKENCPWFMSSTGLMTHVAGF